jgi:ribosomal protein L44E
VERDLSPLPVLSSSILLPPSHYTESRRVSKRFLFPYLKKIISVKLRYLKLRKSGSACSEIKLYSLCEYCNLYSSPNIERVIKSRRMRWAGHVARMGAGRSVYRVLVGKPEERRPLGRPRRRWEDNIRVDLRVEGGGCRNSMELAQDRDRWRALVSAVMNLRVP